MENNSNHYPFGVPSMEDFIKKRLQRYKRFGLSDADIYDAIKSASDFFKTAFSLIMTHETGHRVLQATQFPGINNGIWEHELAADFLMGYRAGLWNM